MAVTYNHALVDHRYLWDTYGPAYDMAGGYVDQEDLEKLLRNPTKTTARQCLCRQIRYWFSVGPDTSSAECAIAAEDPEVSAIAERHGIDFDVQDWRYSR